MIAPLSETQKNQIRSIAQDTQARIMMYLDIIPANETEDGALDVIEEMHAEAWRRVRDCNVGLCREQFAQAEELYNDCQDNDIDNQIHARVTALRQS